MKHIEIYEQYETMFPDLSVQVSEWFPNGKDSIRVRVKSGSDFIFTYHGLTDWCYETVDSFIRKLKGGQMMNVRFHDNSNETK